MKKKLFLVGLTVLGVLVGCGNNKPASSVNSGKPTSGTGAATTTSKVPPHSHVWVEDTTKAVPATCTTDGKKVENCTAEGCTQKTKETKIDALGHDWQDAKTDEPFDVKTCKRTGCTVAVLSSPSTQPVDSSNKWVKGGMATYKFNVAKAVTGAKLCIDAQLTSSSHTDRSFYTNHEGASSSDPFESAEANDGTCRFEVKVNDVAATVTNKTYEALGLTTSELNTIELATIDLAAGINTITIKTHESTGYRLYLGGNVSVEVPSYEKYTHDPHEYVEDTTKSKAATCLAEGKKVEVCACGAVKETAVPVLAHDWSVDATTNEDFTVSKCATCKDDANGYVCLAKTNALQGKWGQPGHYEMKFTVGAAVEGAKVWIAAKNNNSNGVKTLYVDKSTGDNQGRDTDEGVKDNQGQMRMLVRVNDVITGEGDAATHSVEPVELTKKSYTELGLSGGTGSLVYFELCAINLKAGENTITIDTRWGYRLECGGEFRIVMPSKSYKVDSSFPHKHMYEVTSDTSTCIAAGVKTETCKNPNGTCDVPTKTTNVDAGGHKYAEAANHVDAKAATCTEKGMKVEICSVCNHVNKTEIAALGHDITETTVGAGTGSYKLKECSRCHGEQVLVQKWSDASTVTKALDGGKLTKGADYTFTFNVDKAMTVVLSIGNNRKDDVGICPKYDGANFNKNGDNIKIGDVAQEAHEDYQDKSRLSLEINGVIIHNDDPAFSHKTAKECGCDDSNFKQLEIATIQLVAGVNTIRVFDENGLGWSYKLGGEIQLTVVPTPVTPAV